MAEYLVTVQLRFTALDDSAARGGTSLGAACEGAIHGSDSPGRLWEEPTATAKLQRLVPGKAPVLLERWPAGAARGVAP